MVTKQEVLTNITQLKDVISNVSKGGDEDMLSYYEQMLRMQEFILVEMLSLQPQIIGEGTQEVYYTDNFGIVTPENAKNIVRIFGSLRGSIV